MNERNPIFVLTFVHEVTNSDKRLWKRTQEGAVMSVKGPESIDGGKCVGGPFLCCSQ